ncbi:hypothetical protein ADK52_12570, partial [Streptomyces sp. WM6372]
MAPAAPPARPVPTTMTVCLRRLGGVTRLGSKGGGAPGPGGGAAGGLGGGVGFPGGPTADPKPPGAPSAGRGARRRLEAKLVNRANRRKHTVI